MSRRWFRRSTTPAPPDSSVASVAASPLTTTLAGDLSRRLFGKGLLVALPVAAAALLADTRELAEAAPDGNWALSGNAIADSTKFLGTTTAQPLIIKTNNVERLRILASGTVGIGVTSDSVPQARLHVKYTDLIGIRGETSSRSRRTSPPRSAAPISPRKSMGSRRAKGTITSASSA
jgi:hypothetical protein